MQATESRNLSAKCYIWVRDMHWAYDNNGEKHMTTEL